MILALLGATVEAAKTSVAVATFWLAVAWVAAEVVIGALRALSIPRMGVA